MGTFSQNEIQLMQIGQAATKTTGAPQLMNAGEIGIFTKGNKRITEASAATTNEFVIFKKTANGNPLVTDVINKKDIKYAKLATYKPEVAQVTAIGYNGTSGAIDPLTENKFRVRINLSQGPISNHGGIYVKHAAYTSGITTSQDIIARNLATGIANEFIKEPDGIIKVAMLNSAAATALTGTATLTVNRTSRFVTASAVGHGVTAGMYLRIGGLTTGFGVYYVVSVNGAIIELESPYVGLSASGVTAGSIAGATAVAGDFGITMEEVIQPFVVGKLDQDLDSNPFVVTLENFGTATATTLFASYPGQSTYRQIASLEWFLQGNEGDPIRMGYPLNFPTRAEASGNYNTIQLYVEATHKGLMLNGTLRKLYTIALPIPSPNYALSATADDITDVLEVLVFGAVNGNLSVG